MSRTRTFVVLLGAGIAVAVLLRLVAVPPRAEARPARSPDDVRGRLFDLETEVVRLRNELDDARAAIARLEGRSAAPTDWRRATPTWEIPSARLPEGWNGPYEVNGVPYYGALLRDGR